MVTRSNLVYSSAMDVYIQRSCLECSKATLQAIIGGRVELESIIHSASHDP